MPLAAVLVHNAPHTHLRHLIEKKAIYVQHEKRGQILGLEFFECNEKNGKKENMVRPKNMMGWGQCLLRLVHGDQRVDRFNIKTPEILTRNFQITLLQPSNGIHHRKDGQETLPDTTSM
jgi:hypothetical protein